MHLSRADVRHRVKDLVPGIRCLQPVQEQSRRSLVLFLARSLPDLNRDYNQHNSPSFREPGVFSSGECYLSCSLCKALSMARAGMVEIPPIRLTTVRLMRNSGQSQRFPTLSPAPFFGEGQTAEEVVSIRVEK